MWQMNTAYKQDDLIGYYPDTHPCWFCCLLSSMALNDPMPARYISMMFYWRKLTYIPIIMCIHLSYMMVVWLDGVKLDSLWSIHTLALRSFTLCPGSLEACIRRKYHVWWWITDNEAYWQISDQLFVLYCQLYRSHGIRICTSTCT